jgi:hypothetical protein
VQSNCLTQMVKHSKLGSGLDNATHNQAQPQGSGKHYEHTNPIH